jgi:hypothetical protein
MRSQVQVLAGPPPITAGQSAVGSEPGALAAGLGRAGAARPSPPARPSAPPGPPTRAAASTTTTHRGLAPRPGRQPRGRRGHLAPQPAAVPSLKPPATGAPHAGLACLAAQPVTRGRPHPTRPDRQRPPTDQRATSAASPTPRPPRPSTEPLDGAAAHRDSTRSCGDGCPAAPAWSQRHRPVWKETDASGRTGADTSRLDTGRVDTRRVDAGRVDSRRPDRRTPDDQPG